MQELIKRLRWFAEYEADLADESKWERMEWEAADLIESQAAEIDVLKIAHEAHQTSNLKMLAILKQQSFDLLKHRALCDQMGDALEEAMYANSTEVSIKKSNAAIKAWRGMK